MNNVLMNLLKELLERSRGAIFGKHLTSQCGNGLPVSLVKLCNKNGTNLNRRTHLIIVTHYS